VSEIVILDFFTQETQNHSLFELFKLSISSCFNETQVRWYNLEHEEHDNELLCPRLIHTAQDSHTAILKYNIL